jgi:hypothetical protein
MITSEVTELLNALGNGTMTLEDVAQRFRSRSWPGRPTPLPTNYLELATAALKDPEPDLPGSFSEVTTAYDRGKLTRTEYRILAEAAAESMRREGDNDAKI